MQSELVGELVERLEALGVDRTEAEEILEALAENCYADGYDQGVETSGPKAGSPETTKPRKVSPGIRPRRGPRAIE